MINKVGIDIPFAQGLDTKTDPKRVAIGNFVSLENSVFTNGGLLQKRNGFSSLPSLPNTDFSYLTTYNTSLVALGNSISSYSASAGAWVNKGILEPLSLSTQPIIRSALTQTYVDMAVTPPGYPVGGSGFACVVYTEVGAGSTNHRYAIIDTTTNEIVVPPTFITGVDSWAPPRVVLVGQFYYIFFGAGGSSTDYGLYYIRIGVANYVATSPALVAPDITAFDITTIPNAVPANDVLVVSYATTSSTLVIFTTDQTFTELNSFTVGAATASLISIAVDATENNNVYLSWYSPSAHTVNNAGFNSTLHLQYGTVVMYTASSTNPVVNLTSAAQNNLCTIFYEVENTYVWNGAVSSVRTDWIGYNQITNTGIPQGNEISIRSLGLASKAFIINGLIYYLGVYQDPYQNTYFLINGTFSLSSSPVIAAKVAYENGGGYLTQGLPDVNIHGTTATIPYLYQDLIASVNKGTNLGQGVQRGGIYSQTGINLATFEFGTQSTDTAEIGSDLQISGGFLWMYDGVLPVEHNFFVWPYTNQPSGADTGADANTELTATWIATGGTMAAQPDGATNTNAYYYQFTYEWTDNQGNAFRSAPSIPVPVTTTGTGTVGQVSLVIPTLRLTYKIASPVKICIYRWSVANQEYYQVTSIATPLLNDTTVDEVQYFDTLPDSLIIGNALIYTTGGVVEDVNAPASNLMTLFDTRLWLVDAEDPNLLWFSKQVIEDTPVEMSDLFTFYIAPTTGAQGSTGPITALCPLDDKLIIFKQDAIYYINGTGPDNTGANNSYSQPIFITATVGCANQYSVVFMPQGLMFQSDKGIWLLGRDLSTNYIGAPVEAFNSDVIVSAQNIPGTNQVRFSLNSGTMLMYDYYYGQWGSFIFGFGQDIVSATLYQGLHTFITNTGAAYQEASGTYVDGLSPVLMQFTTGPINVGKLQYYQRSYFFYILGQYLSPHSLQITTTFDYETSISNSTTITPTNSTGNTLENWRIFLQQQRCQSFSIGLQEIYIGTPGAAFTLSGINAVVGLKKSFRPIPSAQSSGAY